MNHKKKAPIISGTFQISEETRTQDLEQVKKEQDLDDESMHYARLFMED